ncbi:MAG: carbonic anhydrase family protein [Chloroflexi bacterium]|nr:carbonic anhydrase family protein [Chloroflexota bacterium]MYI82861.1 carbonic anhydrase family protein [Chloroflexota bacterium]
MAADAIEWGYEGPIGPERWASLSEAYAACGGEAQSPVDITGYERGGSGPLSFSYDGEPTAVRNDGKAVHVDYAPGNTLRSGSRTFGLASLHMHAPSEHRVEGAGFAAELHLVHADAAGDFAVVGLLFEPGAASPIVQAILDAAPAAGEEVSGGIALNASACVPDGSAYYAYDGSKTTPPCDEGVAWHVMRDPLTISQEQVETLLALGGGPTNRPIQPIGSRSIVLAGLP